MWHISAIKPLSVLTNVVIELPSWAWGIYQSFLHNQSNAIKYFTHLKRDFIDLIVLIDRLKRQDFRILDGIPKVLIIVFNNNEK